MDDVVKRLFQRHAEMCKVFANPLRLMVIDALREGEMSVGEMAQKLGVTIGNLSQHLAIMKSQGILTTHKEGNLVYYRIANPKLLDAFNLLREILLEQIRGEGVLLQSSLHGFKEEEAR
ncbi:MAG: helix-turn-helix transcriptional regulator [Chloroflexi bacterium]|nr:helix-turn-helix transcriptional regulator [Chloroflexota bacterium]